MSGTRTNRTRTAVTSNLSTVLESADVTNAGGSSKEQNGFGSFHEQCRCFEVVGRRGRGGAAAPHSHGRDLAMINVTVLPNSVYWAGRMSMRVVGWEYATPFTSMRVVGWEYAAPFTGAAPDRRPWVLPGGYGLCARRRRHLLGRFNSIDLDSRDCS